MKTINQLNSLLSSYQVHYQNLRGIHWNIKGVHFFELHVKFEELYLDAQTRIDEIAERILMLGGAPLHTFSDYLRTSKIQESYNISQDKEAVKLLVENLQNLMQLEREVMEAAEQDKDETTLDLMTQLIVFQEKTVWMFKAWLG
jgi:starvation-inducible DNA-binding protein